MPGWNRRSTGCCTCLAFTRCSGRTRPGTTTGRPGRRSTRGLPACAAEIRRSSGSCQRRHRRPAAPSRRQRPGLRPGPAVGVDRHGPGSAVAARLCVVRRIRAGAGVLGLHALAGQRCRGSLAPPAAAGVPGQAAGHVRAPRAPRRPRPCTRADPRTRQRSSRRRHRPSRPAIIRGAQGLRGGAQAISSPSSPARQARAAGTCARPRVPRCPAAST
jgi:hypothetical protein